MVSMLTRVKPCLRNRRRAAARMSSGLVLIPSIIHGTDRSASDADLVVPDLAGELDPPAGLRLGDRAVLHRTATTARARLTGPLSRKEAYVKPVVWAACS